MAKPSLNYYRVLQVGKVKTDVVQFTGIQAALTAITTDYSTIPTATTPFAVYVHPGQYTETAGVGMLPFVDIIAIGGREETIIRRVAPEADEPTVIGSNAMIKGFTIISDGTSFQPRCVENSAAGEGGADGFEIEDCVLKIDNVGAHTPIALLATNSMDMRHCVIDIDGDCLTAVSLDDADRAYNIDDCKIWGGTNSLVVTTCLTLTMTRSTLYAILVHTACVTSTTIRDCVLQNIDFDGGTLTMHQTYVESIDANTGGAVTAYGGTIRTCRIKVTDASFVWWLDDGNLKVLENMLIANALTAASSGDIIHLDAVRYEERIILEDGVHIEGATDATDTPSEIYDDSINPVITAGAVECSIRRVKITQNKVDVGAYCLSVTDAAVLVFSHCKFDSNGTYAIHMTNGNVELDECVVDDGGIHLETNRCILLLDHSRITAGDLVTASTVNHSITAFYTDFGGNNITNNADGATTIDLRYCSDIDTFLDAGLAGTTAIDNSIILTATKSGTSPWTVRLARFGTLTNSGASESITVYGGYIDACGVSVSPIVWYEPQADEFCVIPNMKIQDALNVANANDTIHIGPGTYDEHLLIDSTLAANVAVTLQGDGRNVTKISQTNDTPLTINNVSGVVVRDLEIETTSSADGHEGIKIHTSLAGDKILTLYNVLVDVNATEATLDCGVRATFAANGTFALIMTQCEVDIHNTKAGAGAQEARAISLEAGGTSEFRESYLKGTCDEALEPEYGIYISGEPCTLSVYNSHIEEGGVYTFTDAVAHVLTFVQCDLNNGGVDSDATGATTLHAYGCSYMGLLENNGSGNWECRDSDVGGVNFTATGTLTLFGGDLGSITKADASVVWWRDTTTLYVVPSADTTDTVLQYAITAAAGATAANPITVMVAPGYYSEQITMDDYVSVIAESGYEVTTIFFQSDDATKPTVIMEDNCLLKGFTIINDGNIGGQVARGLLVDDKTGWRVADCKFQNTASAALDANVYANAAGATCVGVFENCTFDNADRGIEMVAAAVDLAVYDSDFTSDAKDIYVTAGEIHTHNCAITNGWHIADNTAAKAYSWSDDWGGAHDETGAVPGVAAPVSFAGTADDEGEFADLRGTVPYTCTVNETLGEAVHISGADTVDEATNAATPAIGVIVYKPNNNLAYVKKHGYVYLADPSTLVGAAFAAGGNIWLGVDGKWLAAAPATAIRQVLGVAKAAKTFLIDISMTDAGSKASTHMVLPELGLGASQGIHATWPVIVMDAGAQTCHFAFKTPDNFGALSKVYIVGIPTTTGKIQYTVNTHAGDCGIDEATATDSVAVGAPGTDITDDYLENLDVTEAFDGLSLAQGRMVGVQFVLDALTTTTQFNVVGLYMEYTAAY